MSETADKTPEIFLRTPTLGRLLGGDFPMRLTLLRNLQYERMKSVGLSGRVLDFGGGSVTNYADRIAAWRAGGATMEYESVNIDKKVQPTYLLKPGEPVPVESGIFDQVISLNTLEHVYVDAEVIAELARILRPGARIIITVPYLYPVHGHPDDYHRGTPSFWTRRLTEAGFTDISIEGLSWGPWSTGQTVAGLPGPMKKLRRLWAMLIDVLYFRYRYGRASVITGKQDAPLFASVLGYHIEATKSS